MKSILLASAALALASAAHAGDFGGAYVGAEAAYARVDGSGDQTGFQGGAVLGYGVTKGKWYIGGEIGGGIGKYDDDAGAEKTYNYGAAARVGYAPSDKAMAYGLIGVEGAEFDAVGGEETDWGIKYGIGIEKFLKGNISIKGEIDYVDWQGENGLPGEGEYAFKTGLNYRF